MPVDISQLRAARALFASIYSGTHSPDEIERAHPSSQLGRWREGLALLDDLIIDAPDRCEPEESRTPEWPEDLWRWDHTPQTWTLRRTDGSAAAEIWHTGLPSRPYTWHTWDQSGIGGENWSERTLEDAKREAFASVVKQGFADLKEECVECGRRLRWEARIKPPTPTPTALDAEMVAQFQRDYSAAARAHDEFAAAGDERHGVQGDPATAVGAGEAGEPASSRHETAPSPADADLRCPECGWSLHQHLPTGMLRCDRCDMLVPTDLARLPPTVGLSAKTEDDHG